MKRSDLLRLVFPDARPWSSLTKEQRIVCAVLGVLVLLLLLPYVDFSGVRDPGADGGAGTSAPAPARGRPGDTGQDEVERLLGFAADGPGD